MKEIMFNNREPNIYETDPNAKLVREPSVFRKDGHIYEELVYSYKVSPMSRLFKLIEAFVKTVFTALLGLISENIRGLWSQSFSGKELVRVRILKSARDGSLKNLTDPAFEREQRISDELECAAFEARKKQLTMDEKSIKKILKDESSLIFQAAKQGNHLLAGNLAKFLISNGVTLYSNLLHLACRCNNSERGYLTAKKLLYFGCDVNSITYYNSFIDKIMGHKVMPSHAKTPLNIALEEGHIKIAALLLRNRGTLLEEDKVSDPNMIKNFEHAKSEIMTKNEKLFKMHCSDPSLRDQTSFLPNKVLTQILSLSLKLELQD